MKSLIEYSVITWDKIEDTQETVSVASVNKKARYKIDYYIFLTILLVTLCLLLLIIIAINC